MEEQPNIPWHKIDQQLWSTSLHGINTINQSQHQPQHQGEGQPRQQQFRQKQDWPFCHCFDHSRGALLGSHAASPTFVGTVAAQTIQHTTAQHVKTTNSITTTMRDNSRVPQLHKGIPSAEQYVLPTPLKVEHL